MLSDYSQVVDGWVLYREDDLLHGLSEEEEDEQENKEKGEFEKVLVGAEKAEREEKTGWVCLQGGGLEGICWCTLAQGYCEKCLG